MKAIVIRRFLAVFETLGHDRLVEPIAFAQRLFDLRISAARRDDGDADDALVLGSFQEARHRRLRHVQPLRNLGLLEPVLVIELGDARDHPQLIRSTHDRGPACAA
jgi:hypothetical protein